MGFTVMAFPPARVQLNILVIERCHRVDDERDAVIATQAALIQRETTGTGQHIDMALLDVMAGTLANQGMTYLAWGISPSRLDNAHPNIAPYEVFPCADARDILAVGNTRQFARLVEALALEERPEWPSNPGRVADRAALSAAVTAKLDRWKSGELLARMDELGVPAQPRGTAHSHSRCSLLLPADAVGRASDGMAQRCTA